jgi:hypothetical protein
MLSEKTLESQILEAVRRAPGCQLDDLMASCPTLTWHQIFIGVGALTRTGEVHLTSVGHAGLSLTLP